jgi:hypothetical protein
MSSTFYTLILLVLTASCIDGHTWLGCTKMVNNVCQGYIRNYKGRNTPTASVDDFYTHKALGRPQNFQVCKPDSQGARIYTQQYPMASVKAGESLNVMYTPNGHSQPGDRGTQTTARIHWTGSTTTSLNTRGDLNDGNRLAQWNYASNCATAGDTASLPCVNGFTIPAGTPAGIYQIVWYWPYDRDQNQNPVGEEYFSCFDVNVTNPNGAVAPPTSRAQTTQAQATQDQNPQTSQQAQPSSAGSTGSCSTAFDDCKSFCAPEIPSVCDCDPLTGAKVVKCGSEELTSAGVPTYLAAISLIAALLALL